MPKMPEAALVAAQTYLYTMQPNPGDPREHIHQGALQGLRLIGNKLTAKDEEAYRNIGTHKPRSPRCHSSPRQRSSSRRSRSSLPRYYKAQGTEEPKDHALPPRHMITKMTKKRWEHRASLAEFAPHLYPKGLNYPMTSRSMMDLRSHNHGSQIICRQSEY
jgi:hypothetical protein